MLPPLQMLRIPSVITVVKRLSHDAINKLMMRIPDKGLKIGDNVDDVELCSLH